MPHNCEVMEMEGESAKLLSISDLVKRHRPVTGASSLNPSRPISNNEPQPSGEPIKPSNPTNPSSQNPNPRALTPLNYPAVLIGTLALPNQDNPSTSNSDTHGPITGCFSFSDDSAAVCCDVLHLDVRIIGKKIRVLAWNYIPFKSGSGLLEIIKWSLLESLSGLTRCTNSNLDAFSLLSGSDVDCKGIGNVRNAKIITGVLDSISPVSVVPCTIRSNSGGTSNLCGFLSQILVCECTLCSSNNLVVAIQDLTNRQGSHCFRKPVIVYFYGSGSCWHPVLTRLVGSVVSLSGLKKKLVFIGKEESQLMYVTTEKAFLHLTRSSNQCHRFQKASIEGNGKCGVYTGVITGIYMQGMVVELDQEVVLLLTDHQLILPHSLRIGAIVSASNVHLVNPKFSWMKIVILGTCFRTSIILKSFSPMETGCRIHSYSQSLFGKFINSLAFSARLWAVLLISCFRKKFAGILSEKEILGSKHYYAKLIWTVPRCYQKEGLAQKYFSSCLPLSAFRFRHGVFTEFCKHDLCGCGDEPDHGHQKLVVPLSSFICHCEDTWAKKLLKRETYSGILENGNQTCPVFCEGESHGQTFRQILKSEDIGVVLIGSLKVCQSSGRMQLTDATGKIDTVIPDLPSTWSMTNIYEVNNFTVVVEGKLEQADCLGSQSHESFSCRSIFSNFQLSREEKLVIYLYFHLRAQKCRLPPLFPGIDRKGCFEELENGRFHMLQITHKFPFLQKNDQDISKWSRIVAEALVLPWDLLLTGKDGDTNLTRISADRVRDLMENYGSRSHHKRIKRFKVDPASSGSSAYKESYGECKIRVMSYPLDTSCAVDGGSVNGHCLISSGTLMHRDRTYLEVSSRCKPGGRIVLLEFESESFCKYELSRIGGYYLIKHHKDDIFCHEDPNDASSDTALITSRTHLWSFSFSSDEVLSNQGQSHIIPIDDSYVSNNDALSEDPRQIELPLAKFVRACPELCSDINITLSPDVLNLLTVDLKELEEAYIKPLVSLEEVPSTSGIRITAEAQSCGSSDSDHLLPEGNLISVHGQVVDVHNHDNCPLLLHSKHERSADIHPLNFVQGVRRSVCIHVLMGHHIVRIFSSLPEHAYPLGFGPGVTATFYRVLVLGRNEIMLIPASFIVINSIIVSNNQYSDGCNSPSAASGLHNVALETLPTALISEIVQCLEHKQMQLHCKVAAVYVLILEKNRKVVSHHQLLPSLSPVVKIPLAGFVLDDGSSSCCCWTSDERAATLLRLHEGNQSEASGGNISRTKKTMIGQPCSSIRSRLDKILEQHGRVVVKNYGSMYDSLCQDLTICVGSELAISSSDEEFLKLTILNACFSTFWTVVGSLMKSDALGRLERRLMKLDLTMPPLQNVWATDVLRSIALAEARNVMEELLNS